MAEFIDRVGALRDLLGLNQLQFTERIQKKRNTYSMWKDGTQAADRDTLLTIAGRWQVSVDSLWGREGTQRLEPSPELLQAQRSITAELSQSDTPGTPTHRIAKSWDLLHKYAPSMPLDGWLEWIKWTPAAWEAAMTGAKMVQAGNHQIDGAAFVLGWYDGQGVWSEWLRSGAAELLAAGTEAEALRIGRLVHSMGLDWIELRRRLAVQK